MTFRSTQTTEDLSVLLSEKRTTTIQKSGLRNPNLPTGIVSAFNCVVTMPSFLLQVQTEKTTSSILRDEELSVSHPPATRRNWNLNRAQEANGLLVIVNVQGIDRVTCDIAKLN